MFESSFFSSEVLNFLRLPIRFPLFEKYLFIFSQEQFSKVFLSLLNNILMSNAENRYIKHCPISFSHPFPVKFLNLYTSLALIKHKACSYYIRSSSSRSFFSSSKSWNLDGIFTCFLIYCGEEQCSPPPLDGEVYWLGLWSLINWSIFI